MITFVASDYTSYLGGEVFLMSGQHPDLQVARYRAVAGQPAGCPAQVANRDWISSPAPWPDTDPSQA